MRMKHNQDSRNKFRIPIFMVLFLYAGLTCLLGKSLQVYAQNALGLTERLTFSTQIEFFVNHLKSLPVYKQLRIFNKYYPVVARELDMENLYSPGLQEINMLLNTAVSESVDVLTLFTHPAIQRSKTFVLDKKTLLQINRQYNLHALFMLSCPSTSEDAVIQMDFLAVGQGKLIIGYNKNSQIKHPDYPFATGRYDYQELFMMDAGTDDQGNYGLFGIRGMSNPKEEFKPMIGPLNASILSLSMMSGSGVEKKILVKYQLFGIGKKVVERIPIEFLSPEHARIRIK